MTRFSGNVITPAKASGEPVNLTVEHGLMGAQLAVAFFGMLIMFSSPFVPLLGKAFILSIAISAISTIALLARNMGMLRSQDR